MDIREKDLDDLFYKYGRIKDIGKCGFTHVCIYIIRRDVLVRAFGGWNAFGGRAAK